MKQKQHIQQLLKMKPSGFDPNVEIHKETEEGLEYSPRQKWQQQEHIDERQVLPNEIVIDIDTETTEQARKENRRVLTWLESEGLPSYVADTGGTGFHIHIFFEVPENSEDLQTWKELLYNWIKKEAEENLEVNTDLWDDGVNESSKHLIRTVGGRKTTTELRKTVVTPTTLEKQKISDSEEVEYPTLSTQDFWKISKFEGGDLDKTWSEITEEVEQLQQEKDKQRKKKLESDFEAEDDGLEACRKVPAHEVLKVFFDIDVEPGDHLYCPIHDSSEEGHEEAYITSGEEKEFDSGIYNCYGDGCRTEEDKERDNISHVHNAIDLLVKGLDMEFSEAKEALAEEFDIDLESTEGTEGTEATEGGSLVNSLLNQRSVEKVRLSGYLDNDTYFHTLFLQNHDEVKKVVVTSDGEIAEVKNKLDEKFREVAESDEQDKEDIDEPGQYDYDYFVVDGDEYRYKHKTAKFKDIDLYTPSNNFLQYLKGKEVNEQIFDDVRRQVKRYWDHYDDEWFDLVTAWIIHTYLVNGIGYTGYIILKGKEDTGKSTLQKIIARLSYNGFFSGKSTPAVTSRLAHFTQSTINLDEFEKNADDEVQGVFNTGQRKGAKYSFTNMNKEDIEEQITSLFSFCPKTLSVNSLYEFDSHFLSRAYILEATRTTRSIEKIENMSKQDEKRFEQYRNDLLAYCLFNHDKVISNIEEYRESLEFSGRESDKIGLICGILDHFKSQEKAQEVQDFLSDKKDLQEEQINQRLKTLFERIVQEFGANDKEIQIKPKVLADYVNRELNIEDEYKMSSKSVGNKLRDYDILRDNSQSSRSGSDGSYVYTIPRDYVADSFTRYDLVGLREQLEEKGKEPGSVASVPSVASVENEEKPYRPEREIVKAFDELDAVGKREGVKRKYDDIEEISGLDPEDFEKIFDEMESQGLIHEQNPGEYVLDKKVNPENLVNV